MAGSRGIPEFEVPEPTAGTESKVPEPKAGTEFELQEPTAIPPPRFGWAAIPPHGGG